MNAVLPFGETAEHLLTAAAIGDDFAWLVLADHLDESGLGVFARIVRDGHRIAFRRIHDWLADSGFDPATMRLDVQYRVRGKWRIDSRWIGFLTFYAGAGFPCGRVAFFHPNPTPSFLDPYDAAPCRPRRGRR